MAFVSNADRPIFKELHESCIPLQRIKSIKHPRGGYIKPSSFEQINMEDQGSLNPVENVPPTTMGMVVDYLTRFATGAPVREAFEISLKGLP